MRLIERIISLYYGACLGVAITVQQLVSSNPHADLHGLLSLSWTMTGIAVILVAFETWRYFFDQKSGA